MFEPLAGFCVTSVPGSLALPDNFQTQVWLKVHKIRDLLDSGKVCAISLAMGSLPHPDPIPSALTWLTSGKGFPHHYRFIYLFITFSVVNVLCGMGTEQKWR